MIFTGATFFLLLSCFHAAVYGFVSKKHLCAVGGQRRKYQSPQTTLLLQHQCSVDTDKSVGLYVHIPFCRRRCRYCDFAIVPVGNPSSSEKTHQGFLDMETSYRDAVLKELSLISKHSEKPTSVRSIYFGGGTPSLASTETLQKILEAIVDDPGFSVQNDAEVTIEIDPGTFSVEKLQSLKNMGFNRLSLGVQSFDNDICQMIGRVHRYSDIIESLSMIQQVYGDDANYSMDLISGLPGLSLAKWAETLEKATCHIHPKPSHLSLYDLQIESGTVFGKWYDDDNSNEYARPSRPIERISPPQLPTAEDCAFMYKYASGYLRSKGYEHYEISSYALRDVDGTTNSKRSIHNQIYWETGSQWFAVGLGATSSVGGIRFARPRAMSEYISWVTQQNYKVTPDWVNVLYVEDDFDQLTDVIMTRLRTSDGLDLDWLCASRRDGTEIVASILLGAGLALELGLAEHCQDQGSHGTIRLVDPDGFLYSNSIISSVFVELQQLSLA